MSFLGSFFGGTKTSTGSSAYTPNVPDWYKQMLQSNMEQAQGISNTSADQGVAGFTPDQQSSFDLIRQMVGQGNPNLTKALDAVSNSLSTTSADDYKKYMNPYTQNVIDTTNRNLTQAADIQKQDIRSKAAMSDAFGSGRSDQMLTQADKNLNQQISDNAYKGLSDAFTWANDEALKNKQTTLTNAQGLSNLVGQQQNYNITDANALNKIGTQQQTQNQGVLDYGKNQTSWFQNLLNQMPYQVYGGTTNTSTTTPTAGWGSSLLGAGLGIASLGTGSIGGSLLSGIMGGGIPLNNMTTGGAGITPLAAGQDLNSWMNQSPTFINPTTSFHADGGLVQKWVQRLMDWSDARMKDYEDNGSLLGNLLTGKYKVKEAKNRLESIGYAPAKSIAGLLLTPYKLGQMAGNGLSGVSDWLTKPYTQQEAEAAKAVQDKQQAAQENPDLFNQIDKEVLNNQAPTPEQPKSPVQDVVEKAVTPVIQDTQNIQNGQSSSDSSDSILTRLLNNQTNTSAKKDGGINVPLLLAGMGMMASDKPFFQAIGEGGTMGAMQYAKEQEAQRNREAEQQRHMDTILTDLQKAKSEQALKEAQLEIARQKAPSQIEYMQNLSKKAEAALSVNRQLDARIKDLQKQRDELSKQLTVEVLPDNKTKIQNKIDNIQSQIDKYMLNQSNNVAPNTMNDVKSNDTTGEPTTYDWYD